MDYYLDIEIVPDEEIPIHFIRNKVYAKFHKALFSLNKNNIGVSFPNYKVKLGNIIRLHGIENSLLTLQDTNWLGGLLGYCESSTIQVIPEKVVYRIISRTQANMTEAKLRRLIKRGSISSENIKQYKAKMFQQGLDNPYFELISTSNGHKHRRYLSFSKCTNISVSGKFDYFGLSKTATIPWF